MSNGFAAHVTRFPASDRGCCVRSRRRYFGPKDRRQRRRGSYNADVSPNGQGWRQCHAARPDGSQFPGSPFRGGGLPAPFAAVVDGNDNVWVSNLAMAHSPIAHLCGVRTENCPPGVKTGDQISPPGGYVGGGLQRLTDLAIGPAGDVWVMNNWQVTDSCFLNTNKNEALSTQCGGNGVTIYFGIAKPVRSPQIGPARAP